MNCPFSHPLRNWFADCTHCTNSNLCPQAIPGELTGEKEEAWKEWVKQYRQVLKKQVCDLPPSLDKK